VTHVAFISLESVYKVIVMFGVVLHHTLCCCRGRHSPVPQWARVLYFNTLQYELVRYRTLTCMCDTAEL